MCVCIYIYVVAITKIFQLNIYIYLYIYILVPEENVASPKHGAQVLHGELRAALLDGDVHTYDMERGFTRHPIDDNNGQGILVMLGRQCIINHMRMLLWDRDMR